jgi:hypothetical protein
MTTTNGNQTKDLENRPAGSFHGDIVEAMRFWEPRRFAYNGVLTAVVMIWIVVTWPHFRPAMTATSLLLLAVLGLIANVCYCAAYLVDLPMQRSAFSSAWKRRRWGLWLAGTLFAVMLANYWIVDEIYPYVQ